MHEINFPMMYGELIVEGKKRMLRMILTSCIITKCKKLKGSECFLNVLCISLFSASVLEYIDLPCCY